MDKGCVSQSLFYRSWKETVTTVEAKPQQIMIIFRERFKTQAHAEFYVHASTFMQVSNYFYRGRNHLFIKILGIYYFNFYIIAKY